MLRGDFAAAGQFNLETVLRRFGAVAPEHDGQYAAQLYVDWMHYCSVWEQLAAKRLVTKQTVNQFWNEHATTLPEGVPAGEVVV
jgi:hypothetical protein